MMLANGVYFTTTTTGTGSIEIGAAINDASGKWFSPSDAGMVDGKTYSLTILDSNGEREMSRAVYNATAGTLGPRTLVQSTTGAVLNLVGPAKVAIDALAQDLLTPDDIASAAQIRAGTSTSTVISPKGVMDAAASVSLTDGATITPDFSAGANFHVTLGGNRTLANPTNQIAGQSGRFRIIQDATGSRTLAFGSNWKFAGGAPTLTTTANAVDVFGYFVHASGVIEATIAKDVK